MLHHRQTGKTISITANTLLRWKNASECRSICVSRAFWWLRAPLREKNEDGGVREEKYPLDCPKVVTLSGNVRVTSRLERSTTLASKARATR